MQKKNRLNKSEQILKTLKNNKKICSPTVNLFFQKNNSKNWKIAIVASKKNFKLAVTRNKVKRQAKAIIRELSIDLMSNNIVLIIKQDWLSKSFQENKIFLKKILTKMLKGAGGNNE